MGSWTPRGLGFRVRGAWGRFDGFEASENPCCSNVECHASPTENLHVSSYVDAHNMYMMCVLLHTFIYTYDM